MCYLVSVTEFVDLPGDQISFVLFHFDGVDVFLNRVHRPCDTLMLPEVLQMIKPNASL